MNRFKASGLHFAISVLIATTVFLSIYLVWYPDALFERAGGKELFVLIACVDVTIGPLITLIIFKPGKKGLKFDLVTIAVAQLSALLFGVYVLYESRPAYVVFVKDRFELARANDLETAERAKAKPPFNEVPLTGPRIVGARLPTDPDEQFRIMVSAASGLDVQGFPQYYVPYDDVRKDVVAKAAPFAQLRKYNEPSEVERLAQRLERPEPTMKFLPMRTDRADIAVIVDARTGDVLRYASLKPWEFQ
jgi:hypothetical protein